MEDKGVKVKPRPRSRRVEPDDIDRRLAALRFANPRLTQKELGEIVGMNENSIRIRLAAPTYHKVAMELTSDIFAKVKALQVKAIENMVQALEDRDSGKLTAQAYDASKLFVSPIANSPQALPSAPPEAPEFVDPDAED